MATRLTITGFDGYGPNDVNALVTFLREELHGRVRTAQREINARMSSLEAAVEDGTPGYVEILKSAKDVGYYATRGDNGGPSPWVDDATAAGVRLSFDF